MAKKTVKTEEQEKTPVETPVIARSDSDAAISSETEQTADNTDETAANSETAEQKEQEAPATEQAADTETAEPAETPVIERSDSNAAISPEMTEPDKTAYTVSGCNIRHDGKTYKEGSQIELTDEEASRLKKYLKR